MADTQQNILINIDLETGQVNTELDNLDSKIKNLGEGAKIETFKSVRNQIREAREEAVRLAIAIEQAGENDNVEELSRKYAEVTKKAADLNDAVVKTNKSITNADPGNRLQGLIGIAQGAVVAVQGLAGAFTILGVDSETANESIARLQGLIALTGAISSIDDIVDAYNDLKNVVNLAAIAQRANNVATAAAAVVQKLFTGSVVATGAAFRALKVAIASTGIGLLVVAIAAAVVAIGSWISSSKEAEEQAERQKQAIDRLTQAYEDETREIDAANKKKLLQLRIQGVSEARIREEQYEQAKVARDRALKAEIALEQQAGVTTEQLAAARKARIDAQNQLELVSLQNQLDAAEEKRDELNKLEQQQTDEAKRQGEQRTKNIEENTKQVNDFLEAARKEDEDSRKTSIKKEIDDITAKYKEIIDKTKQNSKERIELEKLRDAEIAKARAENTARTIRETNQLEVDVIERRLKFFQDKIRDTSKKIVSNQDNTAAINNLVQDLKQIYDISFEVRKKQIELERDANIKALNDVDQATRSIRKRLYEDDAKARIEALKNEIETEKDNLFISLDIFNFAEIDEKKVKEFLNKVDRIIEKNSLRLDLMPDNFLRERYAQAEKIAGEELKLAKETKNKRLKEITDFAYKELMLELKRVEEVAGVEGGMLPTRKKALAEQEAAFNFILQRAQEERITALQEYNKEVKRIEGEQLDSQAKARKALVELLSRDVFNLTSTIPDQSSFVRNFLSSDRGKKEFDNSLKGISDFYDAQVSLENARFIAERTRRINNNEEIESLEREHKQRLLDLDIQYGQNIQTLNTSVFSSKVELVNQIGNAIGSLAGFYEQGTKEAKTLALAEIAINTATGFVNGLYLAQQTAKAAPPPAVPFVFGAFYASQVAAVLAAASRAQAIISRVPGGNNGSTPTPPSASPVNASIFNLPPQAQDVRVTNQASQVVRAYITNEDLRTAQERQQFLNKLSSF